MVRSPRRSRLLPPTRRHATIEVIAETAEEQRYRLHLDGLADRVTCRSLTLDVDVPPAWCRTPRATVNGQRRPVEVLKPGTLRLTADIEPGIELVFGPA